LGGRTARNAEPVDPALIKAGRNTGGPLISNVLAHREQFHQSLLVTESMPQIFMEYSCDEVLTR
jgi:hypothetical protein